MYSLSFLGEYLLTCVNFRGGKLPATIEPLLKSDQKESIYMILTALDMFYRGCFSISEISLEKLTYHKHVLIRRGDI